jgi:peptidoglycan/xylan/chitin deacetylase (PgdA/CDA1 family)
MEPRSTVIVYHAVESRRGRRGDYLVVSPSRFAAHMEYLSRHRRVVTLEALLGGQDLPSDRPLVAITFDDGFRNVFTHALPVLREHGFAATVFVPTKWVGRQSDWLETRSGIMTEAELCEAERCGVEVESHGHGHIDLSAPPAAEIEADVAASRERLSEILGRAPRYLAYPWGRQTAETRRIVEQAGFDAAFGIDEPSRERFAYERVGIGPFDTRPRFAFKTSGRYLRARRHPLFERADRVRRTLERR